VLRAPGDALDNGVRTFIEPRFGRDFSGVRVHSGSMAREAARAVDAEAFTVGQRIVLGSGWDAFATPAAMHLLAHELAHTVQQAAATGTPEEIEIGAPSDAAEREADALAQTALQPSRLAIAPTNVSGAAKPYLRRQSQSDPKPLIPIPIFDKFDIKPIVPGPVQAPSAEDVNKAQAYLRGQSGQKGETDCRVLPGSRAGSGSFKGQCCTGPAQSADTCCPPERMNIFRGNCCRADEVPSDRNCVKKQDTGVQNPTPGQPEFSVPPAEKPPLQDLPERILPEGQAYA